MCNNINSDKLLSRIKCAEMQTKWSLNCTSKYRCNSLVMLIDRCWCFIVVSPEISYKLAHFMDFILHYFWFWFYMNKIWIWFAPFHVPIKLEKQYFRKCCLFFFQPPADWFLEISLEYVHKSIVLFYSSYGPNSTVNFKMKKMLLSFENDRKNSENNLLKCHGTKRNNSKRRKRNYFIIFFIDVFVIDSICSFIFDWKCLQ